MLQVDDKLISLDVIERCFCCDLDRCLGQCCVEGDAGAPLADGEEEELRKALPVVWDDLSPAARRVIEEEGVACRDADGELVTTVVEGRDCVFTTYAPGGKCLCALDKAHREGRLEWCKPVSCHLYPIRVTRYPSFSALNYHEWSICRPARRLGEKLGIPVYKALREPLIRAYGRDWYDRLCLTADEFLKQQRKPKSN